MHFSLDSYETDNGRAWWQEASAVWMEDKVFDEVNDYLSLLPYFFRYPYVSLMEYALDGPEYRVFHPYAAGIWAKFMDERFSEDLVKSIWNRCAEVPGYNTMTAHEQTFDSIGTTFEDAWLEFLVWNYYTGDRADSTVSYSEVNLWSDTLRPIFIDSTFVYSIDSTLGDTFTVNDPVPEPLGANYIYIQKSFGPPRGGMQFKFQGEAPNDPRNEWTGEILGYNGFDDRIEFLDVNPNTQYGETIFRSWDSYSALIFIPTVFGFQYDNSQSTAYGFTGNYNEAFNDSSPVFNTIPTDGVVQAGDCLEFILSAYDPFDQAITFRSEPPAEDIDELTITPLNDTSVTVAFCPGYELLDSIYSIDFYVEDADSNYDTRRIDFKITFYNLAENQSLSIIGYPNPFYYSSHDEINFKVLVPDSATVSDVKLYVFTIAGDLVYEFAPPANEWNDIGENIIRWDGRNTNGHDLAGGIYLVKLRAGDKSADSKIAIIR